MLKNVYFLDINAGQQAVNESNFQKKEKENENIFHVRFSYGKKKKKKSIQ